MRPAPFRMYAKQSGSECCCEVPGDPNCQPTAQYLHPSSFSNPNGSCTSRRSHRLRLIDYA